MTTTESSKLSKCLIRKRWVSATPEEGVRQGLIQRMLVDLGYPKGLISVERKVGDRRFDIVCYTSACTPLLLVECKAGELNDSAENQAFGYNATIQAPFICLACPNQIKTLWREQERIASVPFLPKFSELYEFSKRL